MTTEKASPDSDPDSMPRSISRQRRSITVCNSLFPRMTMIACPSLIFLVLCFSRSAVVAAASSANFGPLGDWLSHHITRRHTACRTTFSFRKPTEEELQRLFLDTAKPMKFNHDFVGMTNPAIHSRSSTCSIAEQQLQYASSSSSTASQRTEDFWIPDYFTDHESASSDAPHTTGNWRTIRVRRTVGYGKACYETLRDVILQWEGTLGQTVPICTDSQQGKRNKEDPWASIRMFNYLPTEQRRVNRSRRSSQPTALEVSSSGSNSDATVTTCFQIGGALKKLVTISKSPLLGIWTYNPCQVIYDLVDERYTGKRGHGLTYSATAYATLSGHLLAGEERVSVAIHDANGLPSSVGKVEVEVLSYSRATESLLGRMLFPFIKGMQERFFEDQIATLEQIAGVQRMEQNRRDSAAQRSDAGPQGAENSSLLFLDRFVFPSPSSHQAVTSLNSAPEIMEPTNI